MSVIIIGCGGQGRVILDILRVSNIEVAGFVDDNEELRGREINGVKVLGTLADLLEKRFAPQFIVAVGENRTRATIFIRCREHGLEAINAIHPGAIISPSVTLGHGIAVMPGAVINTNTTIGDNTIINTNASVDHDNTIAHHAQIQPGATLTGTVTLGEASTVGSGATILPNIKIGKDSFVGAGAVVTKDVEEGVTVVGLPAKRLKGSRVKP